MEMEHLNATAIINQIPLSLQYVAESRNITSRDNLHTAMDNINLAMMLGVAGILLDKLAFPDHIYDETSKAFAYTQDGFEKVVKEANELEYYTELEKGNLKTLLIASQYTLHISKRDPMGASNQRNLQMLCENDKCFKAMQELLDSRRAKSFAQKYIETAYERYTGSLPPVVKASRMLHQMMTSCMTAVFTYNILSTNYNSSEQLGKQMYPLYAMTNGGIMNVISRCEDEYKVNIDTEIRRILVENSGASKSSINTVVTKTLGTMYNWFDFECLVHPKKVSKRLRYANGNYVRTCENDTCVVCFVREKLHGEGLVSSEQRNEIAKWFMNKLPDEIHAIGAAISMDFSKKPDFFQECQFYQHAFMFSDDMDLWELGDASCICEMLQEAYKKNPLQLNALGCWNSEILPIEFHVTSKKEAESRICLTDYDKMYTSCLFLENPSHQTTNGTYIKLKLASLQDVLSLFIEKTSVVHGETSSTKFIWMGIFILLGTILGVTIFVVGVLMVKAHCCQPNEEQEKMLDQGKESSYEALVSGVKDKFTSLFGKKDDEEEEEKGMDETQLPLKAEDEAPESEVAAEGEVETRYEDEDKKEHDSCLLHLDDVVENTMFEMK